MIQQDFLELECRCIVIYALKDEFHCDRIFCVASHCWVENTCEVSLNFRFRV